MDVDDAVLEVGRNEHVLEKAAHHDEFALRPRGKAKDRFAEICAASETTLPFDDDASECSAVRGELQPLRVGIAGDDQANLDAKRAGRDLLDQIAQRRAAAGDEHGDWADAA